MVLYEDTLASLVTYNTRDPHLNERYGKIGASLVEWVFANNGCAGKHGHQILALRTPENYTLHPEEHDYLKDDLLRHIVQIELLILEVIEEIEAPVP